MCLLVLGLFSLFDTPFLFRFACIADTLKYGLSNFDAGTTIKIRTTSKLVTQKVNKKNIKTYYRWQEILKKSEKYTDIHHIQLFDEN